LIVVSEARSAGGSGKNPAQRDRDDGEAGALIKPEASFRAKIVSKSAISGGLKKTSKKVGARVNLFPCRHDQWSSGPQRADPMVPEGDPE